MHLNSYCSCSSESEIIKIDQLSHKMYSNNILNFQESTTILNARTKKKSGNLSYAPRIYNRSSQIILNKIRISRIPRQKNYPKRFTYH